MKYTAAKTMTAFLFLCILMAGCDKTADTDREGLNIDTVREDVQEYNSNLVNKYISGQVKVIDKSLVESQGIDGEIKQYENVEDHSILRYTVAMFGETGRSISEYYVIKDYIYVTVLEEYYIAPIYEKGPDVLYRTFKEGVIYKDMIYQLEKGDLIQSNRKDMRLPYTSLTELSEAAQ